jgi:hypothetical protein
MPEKQIIFYLIHCVKWKVSVIQTQDLKPMTELLLETTHKTNTAHLSIFVSKTDTKIMKMQSYTICVTLYSKIIQKYVNIITLEDK